MRQNGLEENKEATRETESEKSKKERETQKVSNLLAKLTISLQILKF